MKKHFVEFFARTFGICFISFFFCGCSSKAIFERSKIEKVAMDYVNAIARKDIDAIKKLSADNIRETAFVKNLHTIPKFYSAQFGNLMNVKQGYTKIGNFMYNLNNNQQLVEGAERGFFNVGTGQHVV